MLCCVVRAAKFGKALESFDEVAAHLMDGCWNIEKKKLGGEECAALQRASTETVDEVWDLGPNRRCSVGCPCWQYSPRELPVSSLQCSLQRTISPRVSFLSVQSWKYAPWYALAPF